MQLGPSKHHALHARGAALYLAACLALLPLAQGLHLRFAAHDHRFSAEHQRIEDVPRAAAGAPGEPAAEAGEGAAARPDRAARVSHGGLPCAVSNALSAREQALPAQPASLDGPQPREFAERPARAAPIDFRDPLLHAPKQSPPSARG